VTLLSTEAAPDDAPPPPVSPLRKWGPWVVLILVVVAALVVGVRSHSSKPSVDAETAQIASELKCPVCNGETVADSSSSVSVEIRAEIRQDLIKGESGSQILASVKADYGSGVLEIPPASGVGLVVWVLPVVAVVLAGGGLGLALRRWRRSGPEATRAASEVDTRDDEPTEATPAGDSVGAASDPVGSAGDPVGAAGDPDGGDADRPPEGRRRRSKTLLSCAGAVIIAAGVALALVGSSGQRLPGEEITGQALGTDQINSDLLTAQADEQKNDALDAIKEYQSVLNSVPNQVEALAGEGWLLAQTGQPALVQQGLALLQKAESVDGTYAPAHLYRGLAFLAEDDYQSAVPELQWYLNHGPDPQLAPTIRTKLAQAQAAAKTQAPAG
jgi:cytochrome c-type biogenesis protein CcmH